MGRGLLSLLVLLVGVPDLAAAGQVCPPASLLAPLPGVEEITLNHADVSTAGFPGQWQEGVFGEANLAYRLFVDGSGTVSSEAGLVGWRVDFTCDLARRSCTYAKSQSTPDKAIATAKAIGDCLIAHPPKPKARPPDLLASVLKDKPKPISDRIQPVKGHSAAPTGPKKPVPAKPAHTWPTEKEPATRKDNPDKTRTGAIHLPPYIAVQSPPITGPASVPLALVADGCWLKALPDEPATARMQRLLLLAGFDPGPVDGRLGRRTRSALLVALGQTADPVATADNLVLLARLLCRSGSVP